MSWKRGKILGVFEITQDVTHDYETIHRFQWIVVLSFLVFVGILFTMILLIARRAENIIAAGPPSGKARGAASSVGAVGCAGRNDCRGIS